MNENNGVFSILSGEKAVRVSIEIDYMSAVVLGTAVFIVGILLIMISKKA